MQISAKKPAERTTINRVCGDSSQRKFASLSRSEASVLCDMIRSKDARKALSCSIT